MPPEENQFEPSVLQYRFILDHTPAMLWTAALDGQVDYVNEWMVHYTGRPAGQLLGKGWLEVVHPEDRDHVADAWQRALREGTANQQELRFRRADGTYRWHLRKVIPHVDARGNAVKWVGVNTDIHEQKLKEAALRENQELRQTRHRLEAEKEFSQSLLENSTDGILALDAQGNVTAWNKTLEDLSGRRKADLLGKPVGEVLFPDQAAVPGGATPASQAPQEKSILAGAVQRALQGDPVTLLEQDNPFAVRAGWYEIILKPLLEKNGRVSGVLGIVREVTARMQREEDRLRAELLGQRQTLNAVLYTQEEERQRIAESLHNGLGQLLFATRIHLQTYLAGTGTAADEPLAKVDALIKEAIIQSKIISADLVPTTLRDFGLPAALKDWTDKLSTPALRITLHMAGLSERLESSLELNVFRIVQALLGNALHSGAGEAQVLLVRNAGGLSLVVEDNGKGFDEHQLQELELGPGLRSVRNRAALLGGKVSLESTPGKGTVARVYLPLGG